MKFPDPIPEGLRQAIFSAVIVHGATPVGLRGMADIIADAIWAAMSWQDDTTTDDFTR